MGTKNIISITEARKKIFELSEKIQIPENYFILTEKGTPKAVLVSFEEFDSLLETLAVMQQFPNLKKDAQDAYEDYKKGEYFIFKDSGNLEYNKDAKKVSSDSVKKSRKSTKKNSK